MSTANTQPEGSLIDTVKLLTSLLLLVVGVAGFYYFSNESTLYRVLGLLAVFSVAAAIALTTLLGKRLIGFMGDSRTEVRKIVWPTRSETIQTTIIVMVIVAILAIFLLIVDSILGWAVKALLS